VALAVGMAVGFVAPAGAQEAMPPTVPPEAAGLLPGLDPRLVGVAVEYSTSPGDASALHAAQVKLDSLEKEQALLQQHTLVLEQRIAYLDRIQQKATRDLMVAIANVRRLTALVYTKGDTGWRTSAILQAGNALEADRVDKLGVSLTEELVKAQQELRRRRKAVSKVSADVAQDRVDADERIMQIQLVELPAAQREVAVLSVTAASSVASASVNGLGIPVATLDAYLRAEARMATDRPECGVQWWMLAGIGRIESNHGRYGGSQPSRNGDVVPPIIGLALDGSPGIGTIHDTDGGEWDFDPIWDHAVGPMQFIPSTWKGYASDNNGDAVTSPNNVYDAALGAAKYLCRAAGHLGDDASLTRAYLAYNHSDAYAASVLNMARTYQSLGLPKPVA
jgi:membrane-bound lytic murein transglycosylase B